MYLNLRNHNNLTKKAKRFLINVMMRNIHNFVLFVFVLSSLACHHQENGECLLIKGTHPDYIQSIPCLSDFMEIAYRPPDASIPYALSSKTIVDQADNNALYFLNAKKYPMHYDFARDYLSGKGLPLVGEPIQFNNEYYSPYRRFLLGAITYYEGPKVWTYEIAPYDTSTSEMIAVAFDLITKVSFFGKDLYFHPTSDMVMSVVPKLPPHIKVITTEELFKGTTFLPLNLGSAIGLLRFINVQDLESENVFVTPRDIVVLDRVPNDINACAGIITQELQTPLSHVNVLSQNRGNPNMSLIGAMDNPQLRALENKWVRLTVTAFDWKIEEVTKADADEWWEAHKPPVVKVPDLDLSVKEILDVEKIGIEDIPAFGGKASHYGELSRIGKDVPVPKAFAVPVFFYKQFEKENQFDKEIQALLQREDFMSDPSVREKELANLRERMRNAPVNPDFVAMLKAKIDNEYKGVRMRFRSSTNAEDLDGFTGAGLYDSYTYDPSNPKHSVEKTIKKTWASLWNFRAFEERSWRGIDHINVGMAVLCHRGFPNEDANGVALTNNIFDPTQPAFYINVQKGDVPVVKPPKGVVADQFLYFFAYPNQPITFLAHSSLVSVGETVLTEKQVYLLGVALDAIHQRFAKYYNKGAFYAMDVEFKFNTEIGEKESKLWIKQARPHYGWGAK